ncbi:hypothetical protein FB45DRAFT_1035411 [Roridomyces roridus]|uniref:Uncharacterized protein n=1 Tax=Roridomyces roridus TaxID=1738132 RepID=A0AAD7BB10_9AGAR|nr:hypothetical protein FB45DRAFT_1035411 [Roridomyces roridus]
MFIVQLSHVNDNANASPRELHPSKSPSAAPQTQTQAIVSQSVFSFPDVAAGNLTMTFFTCPGLGDGCDSGGGTNASATQISEDMQGSVANPTAFTWNCDQAPVSVPTLADCAQESLTDPSTCFIRPLNVFVPESSGVIVSLTDNTCAMVFLNTDLEDTFTMELEDIVDMDFLIMEGCRSINVTSFENGFVGSVISKRSAGTPETLNWEVQ